jgi:inorganic triphosphatase YgiF
MRLQDHVELEFKLTVVGPDPDAVLDRVAQLRTIGSWSLGPPVDHTLHDIYWELPDGSLHANHLSLRLRMIDDRLVFTAKGGTSSEEGLFRRYELEVPATVENWQSLRHILKGEGAALQKGTTEGVPADWLASVGLTIAQNRLTRRTVRYALGDGGEHIAELALDRTAFVFGPHRFEYREIEIEQIDAQVDPQQIGLHLLDLFPGQIEVSTMGKYSRGLALERELREAGRL